MSWTKKLKKKILKRIAFYTIWYKYAICLCNIKKKVKNGGKVRVGFSVVYDSVFPAEPIFQKLMQDPLFEPFIFVIPDAVRGTENMFYQMDKTYKTLLSKYKNVFMSYDRDTSNFIDWHDKMDLCIFANPYDHMTKDIYSLDYLSHYVLCLHVPYSYTGHLMYNTNIYKSDEYSKFWRIFVENKDTYNLIKKYKKSKINNLRITGYPKMDALEQYKRKNKQTQIIITPHHTIRNIPGSLNISQFLRFADYYLELPKKYPDVNFIFRPHPLLFVNLAKDDMWGKEKLKKYLDRLTSFPNVVYQEGGDYFQTFVDSDAIINDSGSFMVESFYVSMPQCFLLKDENEINEEFTDFGRQVLGHVYKAYTEQDIDNFIKNVVLNKKDLMKQKRQDFAEKSIKTNYPNATTTIITMIKNTIKGCTDE